ncbi:MAG: apolipoprotein N-acyltransferase [Thermotogae bacterium]|nr:MAG: apolipoprotein N-acyltransferase [Thermotogota bacterium]
MIPTLISAVFTALTMPGFFLGPLVWVALVPFILALKKSKPGRGFLLGFLFGYVMMTISLYWQLPTLSKNVPEVLRSFPNWVGFLTFWLLGAVEALPFAGTGLIYSFLSKRFVRRPWMDAVAFATTYTVFEYLRGIGDLGFTGSRLSDALYWNTGFVASLSVWGTLGLTWFVAFVNSRIGEWMQSIRRNRILNVLIVVAALNGIGVMVTAFLPSITLDESSAFKVYAVQTNVPQQVKYSGRIEQLLSTFERFAIDAPSDVDVVIFPEATFMRDMRNDHHGSKLIALSREKGAPILVGFPHAKDGKAYNSVWLVDPNEGFTDQSYSKVKLTPFAEMLPYPWLFGAFKFLKLLNYYEPGSGFPTFQINGKTLGVMICFESYFSKVSRELVRNNATALVVATNDGWFESGVALTQHFVQSSFRAAEYGRYVLQVSNTGITGLFDPYGRLVYRLPKWREGAHTFVIPQRSGRTIFYYVGRYIPLILVGILLMLVFL